MFPRHQALRQFQVGRYANAKPRLRARAWRQSVGFRVKKARSRVDNRVASVEPREKLCLLRLELIRGKDPGVSQLGRLL